MNFPIILVLASLVVVSVMTLVPVSYVMADPHKDEIDVESWSGVDIDKDLVAADQSDRAAVEVQNSLSLSLEEKGERPSIHRDNSVIFGDGERGKRPPPTD